MNVVLLGFALPLEEQNLLNKLDSSPHFATFNFSNSLIRTLTHFSSSLHVSSFYEVRNFPKVDKLFFGHRRYFFPRYSSTLLPFINIIGIKHFTRLLVLFFNPGLFYKLFLSSHIFVHGTHTPYILLSCFLRLFGKRTCLILTDAHGYNSSSVGIIGRLFYKVDSYILDLLIPFFSSYLCLNSNFIRKYRLSNAICIPGIVSSDVQASRLRSESSVQFRGRSTEDKLKILYAGSLSIENGVELLLQSLPLLSSLPVELTIVGKGLLLSQVIQVESEYDFVNYAGVLSRSDLLLLFQNSDLLIHPRLLSTSKNDFSFPSKLLEFVATSIPVLTTPISSIPEDILDCFYYIPESTTSSIYSSILSLLNLPSSSLKTFGQRASHVVDLKYSEPALAKVLSQL